MKERQTVKRGDLVRVTINGKSRFYRARRSVQDIGNLSFSDLVPDPVSDANAFMQSVIEVPKGAIRPMPKCPATGMKDDCDRGCALGQWCPRMPEPSSAPSLRRLKRPDR